MLLLYYYHIIIKLLFKYFKKTIVFSRITQNKLLFSIFTNRITTSSLLLYSIYLDIGIKECEIIIEILQNFIPTFK
jgi:hypothetical protein